MRVLLAVLVLLVAACGQTGDLVLPDKAPKKDAAAQPAPAAPAAVPATTEPPAPAGTTPTAPAAPGTAAPAAPVTADPADRDQRPTAATPTPPPTP